MPYRSRLQVAVGLSAVFAMMAGTRVFGDPIGFSFHSFSGSGTANVFDGGPPVYDAQDFAGGPDYPGLGFYATDDTSMPGSLGAFSLSTGTSTIYPWYPNGMHIIVELTTKYSPSLFPGGDNPGGMAQGQFHSVIEFVMPADQLPWYYMLDIDDTAVFDGSAHVVLENVTRSQTLLTLTTEVNPPIESMLVGHAGDLIRITSVMSGGGTTGPASDRFYNANFETLFLIPEPGAAFLLIIAMAITARR